MHRARGFTLIEVMVALLVSAISLLGLAALQANARRSLDMSYQYSQANLLVQDLAERMRANPAGLRAGLYSAIDTDTVAGNGTDCSAGCSPATIAGNDIIAWARALQDSTLLINGIGKTTVNGSRVVITVMWNGQTLRYTNRPTTCPPLDCLSVEVES